MSDSLPSESGKRGPNPAQLQAYASTQAPPDDLIAEYGYLVSRIARHLLARLPSSVQLDDLTQAGMIGLLEAARNYDPSKGASFATYAGIRIRGSILDDIRQGDWAPRSVHRANRKISAAIRELEMELARAPSDVEVAKHLDMSLDAYFAVLRDAAACNLASFDEVGEDGEPLLAAGEQPSRVTDREKFRQGLIQAIEQLPEREALVLSLYYTDELNLKEIGAVLEVSESRVSQIHSQAVVRLRSLLKDWY